MTNFLTPRKCLDDLRPEKKWLFNFYISFPFSATCFLFSCTWHHTEIQNNAIPSIPSSFSPSLPHFLFCSVLTGSLLILASLRKPWSGHLPKLPLEGDGGNSHRLFLGTSPPGQVASPFGRVVTELGGDARL